MYKESRNLRTSKREQEPAVNEFDLEERSLASALSLVQEVLVEEK